MKLKPILTEKSMKEAGGGLYSFWVPVGLTKHQIKELIGETFGVNVTKVRTQSRRACVRTTLTRKKMTLASRKKALVTLAGKQTIDLFAGDKKESKK